MRKILALAFVLMFAASSVGMAASKHTRKRSNHSRPIQSARPQWNGYYNGQGWVPGYHYNPDTGWNTLGYPGGNFWFRDGYQGPLPGNHSSQWNKPPGYHPGGAIMGFPG